MHPERAWILLTCLLGSGCAASDGQAPVTGTSGAGGSTGSSATTTTAVSATSSTGGATGSGGADARTGAGGSSAPEAGTDAVDERGAAPDAAIDDARSDAIVYDAGSEGDGDYMIGPNYTQAPELTVRAGVPRGAVITFTMSSAGSTFFPGINGTFSRGVAVYVPKQYVPGKPAPFIIAQDGSDYRGRFPPILDNLINDKRLPAMVAIMANNGGGDAQGSERGLEYDTVSGKFAEWVEAELLPRVEMEVRAQLPSQPVTLTKDPEARATMGASSGGAAAFSMGWWHPEWYHRILTYSGTYVNQQSPSNPMSPRGAWEYHATFLPNSAPKPLRVWLEVGSNDLGAGTAESTYHNWVLANQRMAAVLKSKGYHYRFEYANGASHNDSRVTNQTLPEALLWLWRGYPIE